MSAPNYYRNPDLQGDMLPVDIILHPSWWHAHAGITFDEDFFYHPAKRVESERRMEKVLHERFGRHGLGADHDRDLPVIGAVHQAAGFMVPKLSGCEIRYKADGAPDVVPAHRESLDIDPDQPVPQPRCEALRTPARPAQDPPRLRAWRHQLGRRAEHCHGFARAGGF